MVFPFIGSNENHEWLELASRDEESTMGAARQRETLHQLGRIAPVSIGGFPEQRSFGSPLLLWENLIRWIRVIRGQKSSIAAIFFATRDRIFARKRGIPK